ncbi:MAG: OsmC family protein [Burkholderiales bacterium]
MAAAETIASSGFPLGFKTRNGSQRPDVVVRASGATRDVFKVEARHLSGSHQKEAVVTEGNHGSSWRMVSDEGVHIKGDDLAPFPLGFFNAGLQADLANRLLALACAQGLVLDDVTIQCRTGYSMTGAFFRGDGVGYAEPAKITVAIRSSAAATAISALVAAAVRASPALAAMRTSVENTFAIYINGKRRGVTTLPDAGGEEAADPLKTYTSVPAPMPNANTLPELILKTGQKREGMPVLAAPAATPGQRIVREIAGVCRVTHDGSTTTDVALTLPGMSHFAIQSDESAADRAPSGLALISAGIAFCYMTQLSRYIDYMNYKIRHVRLVQYNPYTFDGAAGGIEPVATHLFLHGDESDETHEKFMRISAVTCFLHATLKAALTPEIAIELNGKVI